MRLTDRPDSRSSRRARAIGDRGMSRSDGIAHGAADRTDRISLQWEIEQFLYHEAILLDARRFDEWLELLADDIHYWMPLRFNRDRRDEASEISAPDELSLFDDDKPFLEARIRRLKTGKAWAEDPP